MNFFPVFIRSLVMEGLDAKKKQNVNIHNVNSGYPSVVEENFDGCYFDHGDLHLAEILQDQETLYLSLQKNVSNDATDASSSADSKLDHNQIGRSFGTGDTSESQLALDEAVARSLQELESHLSLMSLSGTTTREPAPVPSAANTTSTSTSTSIRPAGQDDVDPDNMTYEELQSLGESIGNESKGLSDELISFLPSSTYKTGLFSRKEKNDCVICYMPYKSKEVIITLPCKHHYHSSCITQWLKINKACPVCNEEVFGS